MLIPAGYNESQVLDIIQDVLNGISSKYKFTIYDKKDIEQEGFILACDLLQKYDSKAGPLENFLRSTLPNALHNFRRNHSYTLYVHCASHDTFVKDCEACENRQNAQLTKRKLLHPLDLDSIDPEGESNFVSHCDLNSLDIKEAVERINRLLPVSMRKDYLKMKEGLYVPRERRLEIENEVRNIIDG